VKPAAEELEYINARWREIAKEAGTFVCICCGDTGKAEDGRECRGCKVDYSLPGKPLR
jgi:hypothetical protein